jgi:hypothetical protein
MGPDDTLPPVTPQLFNPSASMQLSGSILSPTSVQFSGDWAGDAGTLQTLEFFDVSNPSDPVQLGPEMFFWGSGSGGGSQPLDFVISGITNVSGTDDELMNNLQVQAQSIAESVPEPDSTALLAIGALGFLVRRRKLAAQLPPA